MSCCFLVSACSAAPAPVPVGAAPDPATPSEPPDDPAVTELLATLADAEARGELPRAGAAIIALGDAGSPRAVPALVAALYTMPPLFQQTRRALAKLRGAAIPELIAILRGEHAAINALARERGLETPNLVFYAAAVLGDLQAREAAVDLVNALELPGEPAYVVDDNPGPSHHTAILEALAKLGVPSTAAPLAAYWRDASRNPWAYPRPNAVAAYAYTTRDTAELAALAAMFTADDEDDQLRLTAAQAYARLVRKPAQLAPLQEMAALYEQAALDRKEPAYRDYQHIFEQHVARGEVGIRCQDDVACYAAELDRTPAEKTADLSGAAVDRALVELSKMPDAREVTGKLLAHAGTSDRLVRLGVLLALVRTATLPCDACVSALDAVIAADAGQPLLADLRIETELARAYFATAATATSR
jgi:hypothetical protein